MKNYTQYYTWKKVLLFWGLLWLLSFPAPAIHAQTITRLDNLLIEAWPDYDRTQVLVLVTGFLPEDVVLPAQLIIPIMDNADLNAVAAITADNRLVDNPNYEWPLGEDASQILMEISDVGFRIEYYIPYTSDGNDRQFLLNWQSELATDQFIVSIQRPLDALQIEIPDANTSVMQGGDGFTYLQTAPAPLNPNQNYQFTVNYTMGSGQLSGVIVSTAVAATAVAAPTSVANNNGDANGESADESQYPWWAWGLLILVALAGAGLVGYGVLQQQQKKSPVKPKRARPTSTGGSGGQVSFCHECGQKSRAGDKFCRNCGTQLKSGG